MSVARACIEWLSEAAVYMSIIAQLQSIDLTKTQLRAHEGRTPDVFRRGVIAMLSGLINVYNHTIVKASETDLDKHFAHTKITNLAHFFIFHEQNILWLDISMYYIVQM